jgi:hypothetical protein
MVSLTTIVWAICVYMFHVACLPRRSTLIMRILITVSPRMYREALALAIYRHRPDFEVRITPPEDIDEEVGSFDPHVLVRADNDGFDPLLLERIPCWVEVMYSDHMNARIALDGSIEEIKDMPIADLLKVVDEAERFLLRS